QQGGGIPKAAREIKQLIGLTPTQIQAIENYRDALEGGSDAELKDALSRALRDGRFDPTLINALNTGDTLDDDQIDRMVERYAERYLQYRAETVARSETIRASALGQEALWQQAQDRGYLPDDVKRQWVTSIDDRSCKLCIDLDGETAEIGEEFLPGIERP